MKPIINTNITSGHIIDYELHFDMDDLSARDIVKVLFHLSTITRYLTIELFQRTNKVNK